MTVEAHIEALKRRHADLEDRVRTEQRRPGGDDLELARLKREKLRLKEEMSRLSGAA
ncbi:MAG: YdcH family protein [Paracoccaceae bacterium]|nr:YdcH family protein [Paracoccaceae bacterium]